MRVVDRYLTVAIVVSTVLLAEWTALVAIGGGASATFEETTAMNIPLGSCGRAVGLCLALVVGVLASPRAAAAQDATTAGPTFAEESSKAHLQGAVVVLRSAGLTDAQIQLQVRHPEVTARSVTTFEVSSNLELTDRPTRGSISLGSGTYASPTVDTVASTVCGWAITNHDGSAFARRTARLTLRSDFCWRGGTVVGTPVTTHRSSVTTYGSAAGWRVAGSTGGAKGWIGTGRRQYKTEAKASWTLQFCMPPLGPCREVGAGTAYARHYLKGTGKVAKEQGGWP